jgi:hypothetical protein
MTARIDHGAHVYRCYDAHSRLLYVGHTEEFGYRWTIHRSASPWVGFSARQEVGPEIPLLEAREQERAAIRDERPLFNVQGNPDYRGMPKVERDELFQARLTDLYGEWLAANPAEADLHRLLWGDRDPEAEVAEIRRREAAA